MSDPKSDSKIEKAGAGGKYSVRVAQDGDGLRFAITSPGKTHASALLSVDDAQLIAAFITARKVKR